ncbi:MAG: hypothetical protein QF829_00160, partial [Candidatus Hydrothermarchaeota archaeon]|nr:hypothetical protein [Candidatus Hydrothermarchaeota archaeon]
AIGADDVIAVEIRRALQAASRKLKKHVSMLQKGEAAGKARKYLETHAEVVASTLNKMLRANKERVYMLMIEEIHRRRPIYKKEGDT